MSSHPSAFLGADRPFFTTTESLDDMQSVSSVSFARGDLSVGRYRRDRRGLGISTPHPSSAMVMAVVLLRLGLSMLDGTIIVSSKFRPWGLARSIAWTCEKRGRWT